MAKHVLQEFSGHYSHGYIRNAYRLCERNDEKYYEMDTKTDSFEFDADSLDLIKTMPFSESLKTPTWFVHKQTGYVATNVPNVGTVYLHQHLTNWRGHGKGQPSADHIDRNKLNNRMRNLRIATQSEQNQNRDTRGPAASKTYHEIPKQDRPPFVSDLKANGKHLAGYALDFPLYMLPDALRRVVTSNKGKDGAIYNIKSARSKDVTPAQQMKHLQLAHSALLDGSYFHADGTENEVIIGGIYREAYGKQFPQDVPYTVPYIEWQGRKGTERYNRGSWALSKSHPSVKAGLVQLPQRSAVQDNETPRQALVRFYLMLLEIDPLVQVVRDLQEDVRCALKKRTALDLQDSKRQRLEVSGTD